MGTVAVPCWIGASPSSTPTASPSRSVSSVMSSSPSSSPSMVQWAAWRTEAWSPCTQECGLVGLRHRMVTCVLESVAGASPTDPSVCGDMQASKPAEVEECNRDPCPALYWQRPEQWSRCSAACVSSVTGQLGEGAHQHVKLRGTWAHTYMRLPWAFHVCRLCRHSGLIRTQL